jgi:hypothetical protein
MWRDVNAVEIEKGSTCAHDRERCGGVSIALAQGTLQPAGDHARH